MSLEWRGDAIKAKVHQAAAEATTETLEAAIDDARINTPVLTGEARDSLRRDNDGTDQTWGYHVVDEEGRDRGIWIEIGANGRSGHHALRRAADNQYPRHAGRIARRFNGG